MAITPTNAGNKLLIDVLVHASRSTATAWVVSALFQDTTGPALKAIGFDSPSASTLLNLSFRHEMTSGTTSATTFKVRAGPNAGGTLTFNGNSAARKLGGIMASGIYIQEIPS